MVNMKMTIVIAIKHSTYSEPKLISVKMVEKEKHNNMIYLHGGDELILIVLFKNLKLKNWLLTFDKNKYKTKIFKKRLNYFCAFSFPTVVTWQWFTFRLIFLLLFVKCNFFCYSALTFEQKLIAYILLFRWWQHCSIFLTFGVRVDQLRKWRWSYKFWEIFVVRRSLKDLN